MSNAKEIKQALIDHKVITDVLPGNLDLSYNLTVKWPKATLDKAGVELDREDTQVEPSLYLDPAPSEPLNNLVLILCDPDLMMNNDTSFGQVRHWLVTDVITKPDGSLSIPTSSGPTPYLPPSPLPNYLYSRPHRYVFILARGTSSVEVTADELRELQKPYVAAAAGKQELQDIKDRWGFNAQRFIESKSLKVEAVTFMRVGGTLKSAVETTGMMMQGAVNKVVGN